jgi:serine-type D-Ala-D-Ala carboxypeptidase (penicillin-binding protein 5/6)
MAYARTLHRSRPPRARLLSWLLIAALAAAPLLLGAHLLGGSDGAVHHGERFVGGVDGAHGARPEWPAQGQAAVVFGDGRVKVGPGQGPEPIASLAKVMTAVLTLERHPLEEGEDGFTVTVTAAEAEAVAEEADEGQSVVAVAAGERLSERQLLEALLIPSGNNVARMLAARMEGSEAAFIEAMNEEAGDLGMDATTYTDPSGFDPGTVSTAADQLRVFRRALHFPAFRQIVKMPAATLPVAGTVTNFNPLLASGFAGKTGSDSAAGGCLAFFTKGAIGVVMGQGEGSETTALLDAAGAAAQRLVGAPRSLDSAPRPPLLRSDRTP